MFPHGVSQAWQSEVLPVVFQLLCEGVRHLKRRWYKGNGPVLGQYLHVCAPEVTVSVLVWGACSLVGVECP